MPLLPAPVVALALALLFATGAARAQDDDVSAADREAARALAGRAFELYEAEKYDAAIKLFEDAERKFHAPPHLLFMARAHEKLGRLVPALELYEQIAAEKLAHYAPDAFREAQGEARRELEALRGRVPTLTVVVRGAAAARARVTVDGKALGANAVGKARRLEPGEHKVAVTAEGAAPVDRTVMLAEGATERVEVELLPAVADLPAPAAEPAPAPPPPDAQAADGGSSTAWIALGAGGVTLAAGSVFGVMSLSKVSDIESRCTAGRCPIDEQANANSAKALGTVSTIAFAVGGVCVGAAVYLFATAPSSSSSARTPRGPRLVVGPGSLRAEGSF